MQIPKRKPGKYTNVRPDLSITEDKFVILKTELEALRKSHPAAAAEVKRLAEMGDLSENAGYQIAKGRLRHINERILELDDYLSHAIIIKQLATDEVRLGHRVTIEFNGQKKTFQILGSAESDPFRGIISHNSPIGAGLMGHEVGETVEVTIKNATTKYKIISIE